MEGYFALADLGEFEVKGASRPLRVHELTGVGAARGRLDVSRARGFSRFVGRDEELRALEDALEQAFAGQGQVIGIVGEAGVGKSRLCHEFAERCAGAGHRPSTTSPARPTPSRCRCCRCSSSCARTSRSASGTPTSTARERIAGKLLAARRELRRRPAADLRLPRRARSRAPAAADGSRGAPAPAPGADQAPDPRPERARAGRHACSRTCTGSTRRARSFLANQVEAVQGTRSLVVLNFRPEYHAPWMSRSYYRQIALAPLGAEAIEQLLGDLLGSDPSLDGLAELIRERTEGNPFFIEEIVQALVEAGSLEGERGAYRLVRRSTRPRCRRACRPCSRRASTGSRSGRRPCCRPRR